MSNIPLTSEQRAQRAGTIAKWVGFFIICGLIGPFVGVILTGLVGVIAMVGTWIVYSLFWSYIGDTVANWKLGLLKAAAAANPVETLENEELRRTEILAAKKVQIEAFDGKTRTFDGKLEWYKQNFPDQAAKYQTVSDKMHEVLANMSAQYKAMKIALSKYHLAVIKGKADWTMAAAVKDANVSLASVQDNFMAQLKVDTALDAIDDAWNQANANMDNLLLDNEDIATFPSKPAVAALTEGSPSVDLTTMKHATKVPVKRE